MWLYATMYIYIYAIICMYTTRLKMRMPQSLRFFRPRWMQLSSARLCHTLHNCNTKRPSWFFGCFGCLCKRPRENDVSHSLCCTREQRMQRIPDYKTQREKTAFCEVKVLLKQDHTSILPMPNSLLKLQRTCPCTWQQQRPPPLPWLRKLGLLFDRNTSFILLHAISIFSILFYIFLLSRCLFSCDIHIPQRRQWHKDEWYSKARCLSLWWCLSKVFPALPLRWKLRQATIQE